MPMAFNFNEAPAELFESCSDLPKLSEKLVVVTTGRVDSWDSMLKYGGQAYGRFGSRWMKGMGKTKLKKLREGFLGPGKEYIESENLRANLRVNRKRDDGSDDGNASRPPRSRVP